MASIFQKLKKKGEPYFFEYTDHLGARRQKKGFPDKQETTRMAAKYEKKAKMRREGLLDPLDEKIAAERKKPLAKHLADYEASLQAKRRSEKHVGLTLSRIRKVFDGCRYRMITDFDSVEVEQQLSKLALADDHGPRTFNHYSQAVSGFCNWMIKAKRMRSNPFADMTRLNTKTDVRHIRRALTPSEVSRLLDSALTSNCPVQSYDGPLRAHAYLLAYYTGLRQKELSMLTPRSFQLKRESPIVTLDAKYTKNGEPAVIPVHPQLLVRLKEWFPTLPPDAELFPRFARKKAWLMVKKDLARVGIPYESDDGFADFHSLRVAYIKGVLKGGATIVEAQHLARHSDVRITGGYAPVTEDDKVQAIGNLESPVITGQWNSQYPVQPESPPVSPNRHKKSPHQRNSKPSANGSSVPEGTQESGVGDDCHQPREEWRRRESNPHSNSTQPENCLAVACFATSAELH